jgi:hypothetical protein
MLPLWNHLDNLNQSAQEWSLEGPLQEVALWRLTLFSRWSKVKFKSPNNFEESPYVAARVFSLLVIYENVDIVHVFIEIYRIRY